ncbi:MAG TPA: efflux transporter outer membrane subunit [Syntrophales bacterium]|nr:efflux transporter outer membrane subunit [Syntrophales bacterium]HOX94078.1 efflux transporter outer membrane subunit [Syntrophales bacterium]HPN24314.1 efflux transporter outer membrane subunit [Syntrophales bacterium]HQM28666.1 efflux transporter outer membrane subunit [Syntrophales bacterium]
MKRAVKIISLLAGFSCFLAGCMVGPAYKPPTAPVATQWSEFEDNRLKTTPPVEPRWWKDAFQDAVLDRLIDEAVAGNLTLRSAGLRVLQARQVLLITKGTLFPQEQFVGASAAVVDPGAGAGSSQAYSLNFNLTWEIDVWGRIRRQIESASAALDATLSSYDGVLVTLISEVAQTYLLIRTTEQRLAVARKNVTYQEESVRISRAKFDAGEISALDVEQGQTLLSNTRASVVLLEQSLRQFKIALAILLGRLPHDPTRGLGTPGAIPAVSPVLAVGMPQDLIRRRPDIRAAERRLAAQSAQIGVAVTDLYPQLALGGVIGPTVNTATGQVFADLFNSGSVAYNFGGLVRWNILNYGRIENNIRLQDATFQQLFEDYRQIVLRAQGEVESALVVFFQSLLQLKELQQAADAAQRAADVSMEQYMEGMVDYNTVVSTLRTLATQQDQLASIRGAVAVNLVEVYRSLGGGWEVRQSDNADDLIPEETKAEMRDRGDYWPGKD